MKPETFKLYHAAGTRSLRPRWLLEEMGLSYQIVPVDLFGGEGQASEYRSIHPLGQVPALEIDGKVMFESGAMCAWLTELYPEFGLAPPLGSPWRLEYQQWIYFAAATLEPPLWDMLLHTWVLPEEWRSTGAVELGRHRAKQVLEVLSGVLSERAYIVGEGFTTADIVIATPLLWETGVTGDYPVLQDYVGRLTQRPAYRRAAQS